IAWGIKQVLCDSDRARKWGENGRKRVLQYFTWRKAAEQTLQTYQSLFKPEEKTEWRIANLEERTERK
ncbi:MAG TPA: hypothetical protein VJ439_02070, partial [Candidatus Bathyarchaeia archaeon]|nr:hypothetical protein [Candidatus Bathyarchaeia archaeon]